MDIIWDMCLQTIEVFTLVVGIVGVFLSLFLMVAPNKSRSFSDVCNRYFEFDKKLTRFIDRDIQTETLIYRHNIIVGVCLIVGSAFILVFLFYRLDVRSFIAVFLGPGKFSTTGEVVISAMALIGKMAGVLGLLFGSILLFNPEQMRSIEKRLNTWFATDQMMERLERAHRDVDALVYRRPITFGVIGLVTSVILTYLAFHNMINGR
jgi:hypothetical protein